MDPIRYETILKTSGHLIKFSMRDCTQCFDETNSEYAMESFSPRIFIDWIFKTTHPGIGLTIHTFLVTTNFFHRWRRDIMFPHIRKRPSSVFFGDRHNQVSPGPSSTQPGQKRKRLKDKESWPQPQRGQQLQSGWNEMKLWMPLKSVKGNNP